MDSTRSMVLSAMAICAVVIVGAAVFSHIRSVARTEVQRLASVNNGATVPTNALFAGSEARSFTMTSTGVSHTAHGLLVDDRIRFTSLPTGSTAPTTGVDLFVVSSTADAFTVSATKGGTAITPAGATGGYPATGGAYIVLNNLAQEDEPAGKHLATIAANSTSWSRRVVRDAYIWASVLLVLGAGYFVTAPRK